MSLDLRSLVFVAITVFTFICGAISKGVLFRVKNEVVEKDGPNSMIQVDYETSGRAEVTWCRILKSAPDDCIPIQPQDEETGYKESGKLSLFYFMFLGKATLAKANDEDVSAFKITVKMNNGQYVYRHVIPVPDAESAQASKRNLATPKILATPASLRMKVGQSIHEQCMVESKEPLTVRWFYLPPDNKAPLLLYSGEDKHQGRLNVAAHASHVHGNIREDTELDIPEAEVSDSGVYMCEFTSSVTGDTMQLLGDIQIQS